MKQPDSNPLRQELARGRQGEPHPDADVLTALSEGALQQSEREQVLKHIAVCSDCREVLSIAAAAAIDAAGDNDPVVVARPARTQQRAFLPWASIAAGLLVVCSTVLFYQQRLAPSKDTAGAANEAAKLPEPAIQQQSQQVASVKQNETLAETAIHPRQRQVQAPVLTQGMTAADVLQSRQMESAKKSESDQPIVLQASTPAAEMAAPMAAMKKAAPAPSAPAFMNDGAERALSRASITAAARPHWRINSLGRAERSYGDGAWQLVLPHEQARMRVVSVFDTDVWIGGDHSRLYHSTDNGTTWNLIALPDKDSREHSIVHIQFQTAQSGTVKAEDGTVWTTLNGGSTWK